MRGRLDHLYRLFYGDLRICGCGNPEEVYDLVRDLLSLAPFYEHPDKPMKRIGGREGDDGPYYLILYVLDDAGLIEHGGSVGGSWLTDKGKRYLELMKRHEWDEIDSEGIVGYPHEGQDCPAACRHRHDPETVTVRAGDLETVLAMFSPSTVLEEESARRLREVLAQCPS